MAEAFDTARLRLRPIARSDRALYCALYGDAETMQHVGPALSLARAGQQFDALLRASGTLGDGGSPVAWAMWVVVPRGADTDDGIGVFSIRAHAGTAEIGALLQRAWRGQGLITEAVAAMAKRLLTGDRITRITASHRAGNFAAHEVLRRTGFVDAPAGDGLTQWSLTRPL